MRRSVLASSEPRTGPTRRPGKSLEASSPPRSGLIQEMEALLEDGLQARAIATVKPKNSLSFDDAKRSRLLRGNQGDARERSNPKLFWQNEAKRRLSLVQHLKELIARFPPACKRKRNTYAVLPASMVSTLPVMLRPPSPSRYSTMRATSSASGSRRNALRLAIRLR
jgi:hypothetical protein